MRGAESPFAYESIISLLGAGVNIYLLYFHFSIYSA
jgi:hypothetical protein